MTMKRLAPGDGLWSGGAKSKISEVTIVSDLYDTMAPFENASCNTCQPGGLKSLVSGWWIRSPTKHQWPKGLSIFPLEWNPYRMETSPKNHTSLSL